MIPLLRSGINCRSSAMTNLPEQPRYRFVPYGGGVEEIDRLTVRDRIRRGDIEAHTELALAGSDDWRAAASFPELARYFELAAARPQSAAVPAKARRVESMGERIVGGLLYPFGGGQLLTILGIALLSIVPFIGWLASLASAAFMLQIIRKSADGSTTMPSFVDTSNVGEMTRLYLKVLFVTVVSMAPLIAAGVWAVFAVVNKTAGAATVMLVIGAASVPATIYYPACLATVAVWDDVISALYPAYVFRVISRIGADYFIVIGVWLMATAATVALRFSSLSRVVWIPFAGAIVTSIISLWVLFYASHLLGYAVYRHAPELGWE